MRVSSSYDTWNRTPYAYLTTFEFSPTLDDDDDALWNRPGANLNNNNINNPNNLQSPLRYDPAHVAGMGMGLGAGAKRDAGEKDAEKMERVRRELEDVLAAHCPMCESVVAGLDKPFVQPGEVDASWDL